MCPWKVLVQNWISDAAMFSTQNDISWKTFFLLVFSQGALASKIICDKQQQSKWYVLSDMLCSFSNSYSDGSLLHWVWLGREDSENGSEKNLESATMNN